MVGLDWGELFIIVIVAIIVIEPKDIPRLIQQGARWVARLKNWRQRAYTHLEELLSIASEESSPSASTKETRGPKIKDESLL